MMRILAASCPAILHPSSLANCEAGNPGRPLGQRAVGSDSAGQRPGLMRCYWDAGAAIVVGTEVKVPKGLNRSPRPERLPFPRNCMIPSFPVVTGN